MNLAKPTIVLVDQQPSGIDRLDLMRKAVFTIKTPDAARDLATLLASNCPEPQRVVVGLVELLLNAIEHGNLCISHEKKSHLRRCDRWDEEVTARLAHPAYADRQVWVEFTREPGCIRLRIRDQGDGFDWHSLLDRDPAQVAGLHGRGVAIAGLVSFDTIEFLGKGNEVEVTVDIPGRG